MLQLKDEIYNFSQLHSEELYETLLRFKKKLMNVPNHRNSRRNFLEIFYKTININTKAMAGTITGEVSMNLYLEQVIKN